jgi:caa(3)-type oxidase subunit IV
MSLDPSAPPRAARAGARLSGRSVLVAGAALMILWAASWALSYVHLGSWSFAIALSIALVKGAIVALVFMELIEAPASSNVAILAAVALIAVLVTFTLLDVRTRAPEPTSPAELAHDVAPPR